MSKMMKRIAFKRSITVSLFLLTILGVLSVVLFSNQVRAQSFVINVEPVKSRIDTLGTASFRITLTNGDQDDRIIIVSLNDQKWLIFSDPTSAYFTGIPLGAHENKTILLNVRPAKVLDPSIYSFILNFKSQNSNEKLSVPFKLTVVPFKPTKQDYDNYIFMNVEASTLIDPRNESEVVVYLENRMPVAFKGLKLEISSKVLNTDKMFSLSGNDKVQMSFPINISEKTAPFNDMLVVRLLTPEGDVVKEFNKAYGVISYSDFKEEVYVKSSLLKRDRTIKIKNNGNVNSTKIVEQKINSFAAFFTKTEPEAFYKVGNHQKYLVWKVILAPNEEGTIVMHENFTSLFLFVLLICVLYFIYYYFLRNPIVITKKATVVKLKEGGISQLKVFIHIRNRGLRPVTKVVLLDKLPKIAELEKTITAGTLKPTKVIKHSVKGTVIKWEIGALERFEERIINYNVKSRLSILGWFRLPAAAVKYTYKNKEFVMKSNEVRLEVPKPEE